MVPDSSPPPSPAGGLFVWHSSPYRRSQGSIVSLQSERTHFAWAYRYGDCRQPSCTIPRSTGLPRAGGRYDPYVWSQEGYLFNSWLYPSGATQRYLWVPWPQKQTLLHKRRVNIGKRWPVELQALAIIVPVCR